VSIHFACPSCKTTYTVDDKHAGKKSNCAKCGQRLQVPTRVPARNKTVLGDYLPVARHATPIEPHETEPIPLSPRRQAKEDDGSADTPAAGDDVPFYGYCPPIPKSRNWLLPVVVIGGALGFLLVFGTVLVLLFRGCDSSGGSPLLNVFSGEKDSDLLPWAPSDSDIIVAVDMKELMSIREVNELADQGKSKSKRKSLELGQVERMIGAGHGGLGESESVTVYRLAKPFDPNILIRAGRAKAKKRGAQQYLELANESTWVFNPTANVVVVADNEKQFFKSMDGKAGDIRISDDLRKAHRSVDGPLTVAIVGPPAQHGSFTGPLVALFEKNPEPPPLCLSQTMSTKVRSDHTDVRLESHYSDSDKAKVAATQIEAGMKRAMAVTVANAKQNDEGVYVLRVIYDTFKVESSGSTATITFQMPHKELKRLKWFQ
jgi:predicted Zn finger-like uncharacterized protein